MNNGGEGQPSITSDRGRSATVDAQEDHRRRLVAVVEQRRPHVGQHRLIGEFAAGRRGSGGSASHRWTTAGNAGWCALLIEDDPHGEADLLEHCFIARLIFLDHYNDRVLRMNDIASAPGVIRSSRQPGDEPL